MERRSRFLFAVEMPPIFIKAANRSEQRKNETSECDLRRKRRISVDPSRPMSDVAKFLEMLDDSRIIWNSFM